MRREVLGAVALAGALSAGGALGAPPFADRTTSWELDFVHFAGKTGDLTFPEMMGPGLALFDADGDGDLDLFLVQGGPARPGDRIEDALVPPHGPLGDRLYRHDPTPGGGRFVDVSGRAGLSDRPAPGQGMGVAAGDVDADGDVDLYVTAYGSNRLLRNGGNGTFSEVDGAGGAPAGGWSTSATLRDLDGDGALDLFVARYLSFSVADNPTCFAPTSRRDYCGPADFPGERDAVYRNRGDGTFVETTGAWLGSHPPLAGLGVVARDLDGDRTPEVLVANDGEVNQLWRWDSGRFRDDGLLSGLALNRWGRAEASMGIAVADPDRDGDSDVLLTHLTGETHTYYEQEGPGQFSDRSAASGLGPPSLPWTGFGAVWLDFDNDGDLDLVVVNGAVRLQEELVRRGDADPLRQPDQAFERLGDGRFRELPGGPLGEGAPVETGRGLASGDLDGDGDLDLVTVANGGPARVLETLGEPAGRWLGVDVRTTAGAPAIGAAVSVDLGGGVRVRAEVAADGSFLSASDPRVLVPLGGADPETVTVRGPRSGDPTRRWRRPPLGKWLVTGDVR